jgi:hypothetical protein
MKKSIALVILKLTSITLKAEEVYKLQDGSEISRQIIDIPASILAVYIVSVFLISVVRAILNFRLRLKMVEKGVSVEIINQLLQPDKNEGKKTAIKSFLVLTGIGLAVAINLFFLPIGIHSLVITIFSLAFSYLAYYYYLKRSER